MRYFRDVSIFPSYSRTTAVIAWIVDPSIAGAEFYVYRKLDGGAEWELLNETEPVTGTLMYADEEFMTRNKSQTPSYKILAYIDDKTEYESDEVALYSKYEKKAFGIAHHIVNQWYRQARQDGIPVLYYPAIKNGKLSSSLDSVTGQRVLASCNKDPDDPENDYGSIYAGGYYRPFLTYVRPLGAKLVRENYLDEGLFDDATQRVSMLAYPPVRSGDLVVDVSTDRRWLVDDSIKTYMLKGTIPVGYDAEMSLQPHTHECYDVPIPDNYPEMIRNLTWPQI